MSHDEIGGTVSQEKRYLARLRKRQAAPRQVFSAAAHVREDWSPLHLIEALERRAHGYNGMLRAQLCSAAAMIRSQKARIDEYAAAYKMDADEMEEVVTSMMETPASAPIMPSNISKRNQQPGRLSGGEREALKKFVALASMAPPGSKTHREEVMVAGRALLSKVRKRALGVHAVEMSDEDVVAGMMDEDARETAPGKDYEDTGTGDGA